MTEAIIITAIIVGGLVALAGIALHYGFKAWSAEREQVAGDGSVQIQVGGDLVAEAAARRLHDRKQYLSAN